MNTDYRAAWLRAEQEIRDLTAQRDDLADALREHQWNAYTFVGMRPCIACGNEEKEGHQPGCPVGAALDRHTQRPDTRS